MMLPSWRATNKYKNEIYVSSISKKIYEPGVVSTATRVCLVGNLYYIISKIGRFCPGINENI